MKKIVFVSMPITAQIKKGHYISRGDSTLQYDGEVSFAINAVLAKKLVKNDDVKIVLLKTESSATTCDYTEMFKKELEDINKTIGASINYKTISFPYTETKKVHEGLMRRIVDEFTDKAEVYADITYGAKPLPIVIFSALNFADKFFGCDIKNIIYGKVDFIKGSDGKMNPENHELLDMAALYYLNSIASSIGYKTGDEAKNMLDNLLSI